MLAQCAHVQRGHWSLSYNMGPVDGMDPSVAAKDYRGLALASVVIVFAFFGLIITLMPRTDPQQWGAVIAVGLVGPIGGIILASFGGLALRRAKEREARIAARIGIGLSVAGIISALSLWSL